jgi:hypothetical protein
LGFANKKFYTPIIEEGQCQKIELAIILLVAAFSVAMN